MGGFPITGQFLICTNDIIAQHDAKVYGKEPPGTPPMTVPHLDTRYIDGERTLLFGPFASVGPKFLKMVLILIYLNQSNHIILQHCYLLLLKTYL